MSVKMFSIVPTMVLAPGTAAALTQPTANPFFRLDQAGAIVTNAAFVSDGCSPSYLPDQQNIVHEPGYSIGTGDAQLCNNAPAGVTDGSDPAYQTNQQKLLREPG